MKVKVFNGNPSGEAQRFWNMAALNETDAEITLYGDVLSRQYYDWNGDPIPGNYITPEGFMQDLELVRGKQNVTVKINSCGGDLYTGIAIHNALKGLDANITTVVEGIAASAASVIAMAGDTVSVFPGSLLMIHGVKVYNYDGMNIQDVKKLEQMMEASEKAIAEIYSEKTGIETDKLRNMMAKEKWMTGKEAVDLGFADNILEDEAEVKVEMSANKKVLMVNGIKHDSAYFRAMPDFPVLKPAKPKNSAKPTNKPDANTIPKKEDKKMTIEELREQHADLVTEIENAARSSVDVAAAVAAERARIADIDSIAASIPDQTMVNEAKYGETACTAQELSFRVLQNSAKQGAQFLTALQADNAASGTAGVGAAPVNGAEPPTDSKAADEAELKAVFDAFNKMKGVRK